MRHPFTPLARTLRANPTPAERRLWHFLRQRPVGFKFRRQLPIDQYIVDFACFGARLVVEVDGRFHAEQVQDLARDARLKERGWEVLRYWNDDIRLNADGVLADIEKHLLARCRIPHPTAVRSPAPLGGAIRLLDTHDRDAPL